MEEETTTTEENTTTEEPKKSFGEKVSEKIDSTLKKTKPVKTIVKTKEKIDEFNDWAKKSGKGKEWNDNYKKFHGDDSSSSTTVDEEAQAEAEKQHDDSINAEIDRLITEKKWSEARAKANELYNGKDEALAKIDSAENLHKDDLTKQISDNILASRNKADKATWNAVQKLSYDGSDNFKDMNEADSALKSMQDDATYAARAVNENIMANRKTAYSEAVKAGQDLLKAEGYEDAANNLEEGAKLLDESATWTNWAQTALTVADVFSENKDNIFNK